MKEVEEAAENNEDVLGNIPIIQLFLKFEYPLSRKLEKQIQI